MVWNKYKVYLSYIGVPFLYVDKIRKCVDMLIISVDM